MAPVVSADRKGDGAAGEVLLEATSLVKRYGSRTVVDVERLVVERGRSLAVLGPNGAGKSTLCRMLALLEEADSGELTLFGRKASPRDLAARRRIAMVFQRPILFQGRVVDNVAYGLRLRGVARSQVAEKVDAALELMGIADYKRADVRTLSGGELQRVALARALVLEPEVLFLDEPTSSLDQHLRRQFREDLRLATARLSTTVVIITHDLAEALELAQTLAVMREGRIVQAGTVEEVLDRPVDEFVATFTGVETVWEGTVASVSDGLCFVETPAGVTVVLIASAQVGDSIRFAIRPEDVLLEPDGSTAERRGSARNVWRVVVEGLTPCGPLVRVRVTLAEAAEDAPGCRSLVALVTRPAAGELGLSAGVCLHAAVKATALIPLGVGHVH